MKHGANALTIISLGLLSFGYSAADEGKTANGCTYKVVSGKYVSECPPKNSAGSWATQSVNSGSNPKGASTTTAQRQPSPIVESYSNVPVAGDRTITRSNAPIMAVPMELAHQGKMIQEENPAREMNRGGPARIKDGAYIGASLGSVTANDSHLDAGAGLGVTVGTNLDEFFGAELSYSYAEMSGSLGLNRRQGIVFADDVATDIQIRNHWVSAEALAHITDETNRLRPYGGLGIDWKNSSMKDIRGSGLSRSFANTLSQNSVGLSSSVGAKLRVSHDVQIGLAGKFFLPFWRQDPELQSQTEPSPNTANGAVSEGDRAITGAGVWSILGSVQYLF